MATPTPRRIDSPHNALFKSLRKLVSGRGVKRAESLLVSGPKVVRDLLGSRPELCEAWISAPGQPEPPEGPAVWYQLAPALFNVLDVFGTHAPLLLVHAPAVEPWRVEDGIGDGCTLFVPFQDPENVGAVIRTAVAFGVMEVIVLKEGGYPFHPRAVRASGGAVFQAMLRSGPPLADLPAELPLVPLSAEGSDVSTFVFPGRFGLVPGIEGPGLPAAMRRQAISIPISSQVESLNAATATAIALYVWAQGRKGSRMEPI